MYAKINQTQNYFQKLFFPAINGQNKNYNFPTFSKTSSDQRVEPEIPPEKITIEPDLFYHREPLLHFFNLNYSSRIQFDPFQ